MGMIKVALYMSGQIFAPTCSNSILLPLPPLSISALLCHPAKQLNPDATHQLMALNANGANTCRAVSISFNMGAADLNAHSSLLLVPLLLIMWSLLAVLLHVYWRAAFSELYWREVGSAHRDLPHAGCLLQQPQ